MKSAAILIGLNTYPPASGLTSLSGAVNDCQDFAALLLKYELIDPEWLYAYLYDTTPLAATIPGAKNLIDPGHVRRDGAVTRDTLVGTRQKVISKLGENGVERLFVYLSGHGADITQATPPVSVLISADFVKGNSASNLGLLVTDHVQNAVHNAPRIREAIIISDSCRTVLPALTKVPYNGAAEQFKTGTRCLTIKSSVHSMPSVERDVKQNKRIVGTFTHALIEELEKALGSGKGEVLWRDICDRIAKRQEDSGDGQRLDYQQVTAYPLLKVRAAQPATAPQVTTIVLLERDQPKGRHAALAMPTPVVKQGDMPPGFMGMLASSSMGPGSRRMSIGSVKSVRRSSRVLPKQEHRPRGKEVDLRKVYDLRSLINGIATLQEVFRYLSPEEQQHLHLAKTILSTEGDKQALKRLPDQVSVWEWTSVLRFLEVQISDADPLSAVNAPATADGFTFKVREVVATKDPKRVRVHLIVDGTQAKIPAPAVRVYQHPTLVPVMLDVAFSKGEAAFQLEIWGCFSVVAQVYGGPRLKLDLSREEAIPAPIQRI